MATHFSLACPACQSVLRVNKAHAGKRVKCAKCQTALRVPAADQAAASPPGDDSNLYSSADLRRKATEALQAGVPRVRRTLLYRATSLVVLVLMLVLPLV